MTDEEYYKYTKCPECRELKKPCEKCRKWANDITNGVSVTYDRKTLKFMGAKK